MRENEPIFDGASRERECDSNPFLPPLLCGCAAVALTAGFGAWVLSSPRGRAAAIRRRPLGGRVAAVAPGRQSVWRPDRLRRRAEPPQIVRPPGGRFAAGAPSCRPVRRSDRFRRRALAGAAAGGAQPFRRAGRCPAGNRGAAARARHAVAGAARRGGARRGRVGRRSARRAPAARARRRARRRRRAAAAGAAARIRRSRPACAQRAAAARARRPRRAAGRRPQRISEAVRPRPVRPRPPLRRSPTPRRRPRPSANNPVPSAIRLRAFRSSLPVFAAGRLRPTPPPSTTSRRAPCTCPTERGWKRIPALANISTIPATSMCACAARRRRMSTICRRARSCFTALRRCGWSRSAATARSTAAPACSRIPTCWGRTATRTAACRSRTTTPSSRRSRTARSPASRWWRSL